jgi:hypothetical protein
LLSLPAKDHYQCARTISEARQEWDRAMVFEN